MPENGVAQEVEQFVPQEALDGVDLAVPDAWLVEVMAAELTDFLREYHKVVSALRAARQVGDHQKAEQLAKNEAYFRVNIALIQHRHPEAKVIAQKIMRTMADQVSKQRDAALKG